MDKRPICCKDMQRMTCVKTGEVVVYTANSNQHGDRFQCPLCGNEVIIGLGDPYLTEVKSDKSTSDNM